MRPRKDKFLESQYCMQWTSCCLSRCFPFLYSIWMWFSASKTPRLIIYCLFYIYQIHLWVVLAYIFSFSTFDMVMVVLPRSRNKAINHKSDAYYDAWYNSARHFVVMQLVFLCISMHQCVFLSHTMHVTFVVAHAPLPFPPSFFQSTIDWLRCFWLFFGMFKGLLFGFSYNFLIIWWAN